MNIYLQLRSLYSWKYSAVILLTAITIIGIGLLMRPLTTHADTTSTIPLCEITRGLKVGSSGEDVKCLQRYLNWAGFTVASTGVGSPGNESLYFGSLTSSAVARWQEANSTQVLMPVGLTTGTGFFGTLSFARYVSIVRVALGLPA